MKRFKNLTKLSVVCLICTAPVFSQTLSQARTAAAQGEVSKLKKIIQNNPDLLEAKADDDFMLLHYVVMWGDKNKEGVTELLLSMGADVNARTVDNDTPLYFAVYVEKGLGDYCSSFGLSSMPSCIMRPMISISSHSSTNFPFSMRLIIIPLTSTLFPVAGIPINSPS